MKKFVFVVGAVMLSSLFSGEASARKATYDPQCNITFPCVGVGTKAGHVAGARSRARQTGVLSRAVARFSVSLDGVNASLAAKVRAIQAACPGTKIISTIRFTRIAGGGGALSKHASGRAVDVKAAHRTHASYACIYDQLRDWDSYSSDGVRCNHVHISIGEPKGFRHYRC